MSQFLYEINQCHEASQTSGKAVSHFYKFEKKKCICVFCGKTIFQSSLKGQMPFIENFNSNSSIVGQRS